MEDESPLLRFIQHEAMGLSVSDAIRMLMMRVADEQRLPFDVKAQNASRSRIAQSAIN